MNTKIITHILFAACALVFSGVCSAAFYAPPPAKAPNRWFFGGEVSALEPLNNDLHYAEEGTGEASMVLGGALVHSHFVHVLDTDFDIGFSLEAGVHFDKTNDLTFNYTYFNGDDSEALVGPANTIHGRFGDGELLIGDSKTVLHGHVDFETHIVNVEFGHTAGFGNNTTYRFHGGVQIADLDNKFKTDEVTVTDFVVRPDSDDDDEVGHVSRRAYYALDSEFTGVGPRFGADGEYRINNDFSLVGKTAVALLVGDLDTSIIDKDFEGDELPDTDANLGTHDLVLDSTTTNHMSETVLVPEFEAKLGIKYTHKNGDNGEFSLEGGYRVNDYVAAIKWLHACICAVNPWPSHLGLHGVYLAGRFTAA